LKAGGGCRDSAGPLFEGIGEKDGQGLVVVKIEERISRREE